GVDGGAGPQERAVEGVRSTAAVGGVASGETVELPGRSVNPAEECPGTRGTMPSAFRISRNTLPHAESSTCRAMTIDKIRFDCSDRPGTATYAWLESEAATGQFLPATTRYKSEAKCSPI